MFSAHLAIAEDGRDRVFYSLLFVFDRAFAKREIMNVYFSFVFGHSFLFRDYFDRLLLEHRL
jgi:hypothetical protein